MSVEIDTGGGSPTAEGDAVGANRLEAEVLELRKRLARSEERAANLAIALDNTREIAYAVGIIIDRYHCSPDDAFELLRIASHTQNRKVRDMASDIVYSGELEAIGMIGPQRKDEAP